MVAAQGLNEPVGFDFLRDSAVAGIGWLEEVKVYRLSHNPPNRQARYTLFDDRTSPYDGEYLVADISYCSDLEKQPAELLFALCKELMHVFDDRDTWIDSREKFIKFLKDLQNTPFDAANGALNSEHRAKWMALAVLIPKHLRDSVLNEINEGRALRAEVADRLGIPESILENALDDYYDVALTILTSP